MTTKEIVDKGLEGVVLCIIVTSAVVIFIGVAIKVAITNHEISIKKKSRPAPKRMTKKWRLS